MNLHNASMLRVAVGVSLIGLTASSLSAQTQDYIEGRKLSAEEIRQAKAEAVPGKQRYHAGVTFSANDITIKDAVNAIARQAGLRVIFDSEAALNRKLPEVNIKAVPALKAIETVLKGSGVTVTEAKDGNTVLLRSNKSEKDSTERKREVVRTISGKVIDGSGRKPIAGAVVSIPDFSVVTDNNGNFQFRNISSGSHTLVTRMLGYTVSNHVVRAQDSDVKDIVITLHFMPERLAEVVTTGAGERRRAEVGNSSTVISADSIVKTSPILSVEDLIKSRSPGTQVLMSGGTVGSGSRIRIRGVSGLLTNSDPILIVDGIRMDATYTTKTGASPGSSTSGMGKNQASGGVSATSRLNDIDIETIESIEILKGPSAASLFGSDAANGVIVIKTKRGQAGPARWSLGLNKGISKMNATFPNAYFAWGSGSEWSTSRNCPLYSVAEGICEQDSITSYNPLNHRVSTPFGTGSNTSLNAQVSGGTSQIRYFLGVTRTNEVGLLKMPDSEKQRILPLRRGAPLPAWALRPNVNKSSNLSANFATDISSDLNVDIDLKVMSGYHRDAQQSAGSFISEAITGLGYRDSIGLGWGDRGPAAYFLERTSDAVKRASGALNARYRLSDKIVLNGTGGADFSNRNDERLLRPEDVLPTNSLRNGLTKYRSDIQTITSNLSGVFEMPLRYGIGSRTTTGLQFLRTSHSSLRVSVSNLAPGRDVIDAGTVDGTPSEGRYDVATRGWFVDQHFSLRSNLFVTAALRGDVGSSFGSESKAMLYPKFNASWLVSEESFFPANRFLTNLRVRTAFGQAGIQPGSSARFRSYNSTNLWVDGSQQPAFYISSMGNTKIIPERSMEFEGGFEAGILDDRIVLDLTAYYKRVNNALVVKPLPESFGMTRRMENIGDIKNTGTEASVTLRPIDMDKLTWSVTSGYSSTKNILLRLGSTYTQQTSGTERYVEGYPLNGQWARPLLAYNDDNQDGIISYDEILVGDSAVFLGTSLPKYEMFMSNNVGFWNGRVLFSTAFSFSHNMTQTNSVTLNQCVVERCPDALLPGTSLASQALSQTMRNLSGGVRNLFATHETVSWIRWGSASLTFQASPEIAKRLKSNSLSVSLMGRNLGMWSNYKGADPEVNANGNGNFTRDTGMVPQTRDWTIRINLGF